VTPKIVSDTKPGARRDRRSLRGKLPLLRGMLPVPPRRPALRAAAGPMARCCRRSGARHPGYPVHRPRRAPRRARLPPRPPGRP
jgi:hypothetical protein